MLCGYRSYSAISEWGRYYGQDLARALGFTHLKTPCASTLHNVLSQIDRASFEAALASWAESLLEPPTADAAAVPFAVAIDGKSLRGSRNQGAPGAHLLSAVSHKLGLTLAQSPVPDETNELSAFSRVISGLVLKGRVITVDAMFTNKAVANSLLERGADYLMVVKENQSELLSVIKSVMQEPKWFTLTLTEAETTELGHGRIEHRKLWASSTLAGQGIWPGLQQIIKLERSRQHKRSDKRSHEEVYAVTSLEQRRADAQVLMKIMRGHWTIENKSHWVRDVTYDEDRSQVRRGSIPQVMAALRNMVIGLIRSSGESNIAAACRKFAARPWSALALIGIKPEN
jgi:predicted transposase YbfD/YdcC